MDPLKTAEGTGGAPTCLLQNVFKTKSLLFAPLLFGSSINLKQVTTFSTLAGVGIDLTMDFKFVQSHPCSQNGMSQPW
jgi:hypothetical protein